jgi:hypothetical protein
MPEIYELKMLGVKQRNIPWCTVSMISW